MFQSLSRLFSKADTAPVEHKPGLWDNPVVREVSESMITIDWSKLSYEERLAAVNLASEREQRYARAVSGQDVGPYFY